MTNKKAESALPMTPYDVRRNYKLTESSLPMTPYDVPARRTTCQSAFVCRHNKPRVIVSGGCGGGGGWVGGEGGIMQLTWSAKMVVIYMNGNV